MVSTRNQVVLARFWKLLAAALLLSGALQPAASTSATAPTPPEKITTRSAASLERLSPDLRQAAQAGGDAPLLVTALIEPGAPAGATMLNSVTSRTVAGLQWVTGEIPANRLRKLASVPGVISVISPDTFQPADAPGLEQLRAAQPRLDPALVRRDLAAGRPDLIRAELGRLKLPSRAPTAAAPPGGQAENAPAAGGLKVVDIHGATAVHAAGIAGTGVVVALVDTGVDFGHPDLQGTQALIPSGPYAGWPFAYDALSAARYALDSNFSMGLDNIEKTFGLTHYAHTTPMENPACAAGSCSGNIIFQSGSTTYTESFSWPDRSKSGKYYYTVDPSYDLLLASFYLNLFYPDLPITVPMILVADETTAGQYDAAYVDINMDRKFTPEERLSRDRTVVGADLNKDGTWDITSGMLSWISDGANYPPGVETIYPEVSQKDKPEAGRLLTIITDEVGHGTSCAGLIAAQGVISDPNGRGPMNPRLAGSINVGGVGGAVLDGMAPQARIAAFEDGLNFPLDSWTLATLGFDGVPGTGDEAQIVSNSFGNSEVIEDGWDPVSRFASELNRLVAPQVSFLAAAGNGGPGFGTVTAPNGGTILGIGASTSYGSMRVFENVGLDQFTYGDIQPWSNRGPTTLGSMSPNLVAVGAWGSAAAPLNLYFGDGQSAYDIFGGTSMSTPVAAGGMALLYQAFRQERGRWPTWEEARTLLLAGAQDLGYDPSAQGSGNLRIDRSIQALQGSLAWADPAQWAAGDYHGQVYPDYPAILHSGQEAQQDFTLHNPTSLPIDVKTSGVVLSKVYEQTFSFSYIAPRTTDNSRIPIFLRDITAQVDAYHPDLVRAQVILPYNKFDPDGSYFFASWWSAAFYDWKDLNHNGRLWLDSNQNGIVDPGEIDIDPASGLYEFNRFSYGYPAGTNLEVDLGSDSLSRRHDGVYLGLNCAFCGQSLPLQVRLTFYQDTPWNWLELPQGVVNVPAGGEADFPVRLKVPGGAGPGFYEGALRVELPGRTQSIPVSAVVAAGSPTFDFGGQAISPQPLDNSHLNGGFNWNWQYDAGDWRFLYFDAPPGSAQPGVRSVIDARWNSPNSDVDVWAFGSQPDAFSRAAPEFFGPSGLVKTGGSKDTYIGNGKFIRQTSTGYDREVVSSSLQDGLGMLALHQVLSGGDQFSEPVSGSIYQVRADPSPLNLESLPAGLNPPRLSGTQTLTVTASHDIPDGLGVLAYGFSAPIDLKNQPILQDERQNLCSASWIYQRDQGGLAINGGGLLDITTTSSDPSLDVDLYVFADNGDGRWRCGSETLIAISDTFTSNEEVRIQFPQDGVYWIMVNGYTVPRTTGNFDIHISAIQGGALRLGSLPIGPVPAGQPLPIQVSFNTPFDYTTPTQLEGLVLLGPPAVPGLIEVPVTVTPSILIYPAPRLFSARAAIFAQPVTFHLGFQNVGSQSENVQVAIPIPAGLDYVPGSAQGPGAPPSYDPAARSLAWTGPDAGGQAVELSFQVTALPGFTPGAVSVPASVTGLTSGQHWDVSAVVQVNQELDYFPLVGR